MRLLPLTQGHCAIVDDDVYLWASKMKWCYANGYAVRWDPVHKRLIYLHREIMDASDGVEVDHRNHNTLDYQSHNLRLSTHQQNHQNQLARKDKKDTKYKGVYRSRTKWQARIVVKGRDTHIGIYPTDKVAALAYNKAAKLHFGEFAFLNVIDKEFRV